MKRWSRTLVMLTALLLLNPVAAEEGYSNPDPWEKVNRKVYRFNTFFDDWFMRPVAKGYRFVTPDPVETGVSNFFHNLGEVVTVVNDLGQLKFKKAGKDTARFLINTTIGIGGVLDVASSFGLEREKEDFGQTLGHWGVPTGPYVVLPFLGPSNVRDGSSLIVDFHTHPVSQVNDISTRNSITGLGFVELRAQLLQAEDLVTGDEYLFLRDAYLQSRKSLVLDGDLPLEDDDFGDEDF